MGGEECRVGFGDLIDNARPCLGRLNGVGADYTRRRGLMSHTVVEIDPQDVHSPVSPNAADRQVAKIP